MEELVAISPVDGRYAKDVSALSGRFSEFAFIKYRIRIEVEYLVALSEAGVIRKLTVHERRFLRKLHQKFSLDEAKRIKEIERRTRHDVKAIEYYIKEVTGKSSLEDLKCYVHFGLTSEDVNNLAYSCMLRDTLSQEYLPVIIQLEENLIKLAEKYKAVPMLSRTHGQPASPTTLGKEFVNFAARIVRELRKLDTKLPGKLNGAVGNYSALHFACPNKDWIQFSTNFISSLGLEPELITSQVIPHDKISELLHTVFRINNIVINLDRDMWQYLSYGYFRQTVLKDEVGSSTMPHKVSPVDLENSEGNLEVANSLINLLAGKLQITRLQRDLSDSTVKRNYGLAFAHSIIALKNTIEGLDRVHPDAGIMKEELLKHPEVLTEAFQTVLKTQRYEAAFEDLKQSTRGKKISLQHIHGYIKNIKMESRVRKRLLALTPEQYLGLSVELTELGIKECKGVLSSFEHKTS